MGAVAKRHAVLSRLVEVVVALFAAGLMVGGAIGLNRAVQAFPATARLGAGEASVVSEAEAQASSPVLDGRTPPVTRLDAARGGVR